MARNFRHTVGQWAGQPVDVTGEAWQVELLKEAFRVWPDGTRVYHLIDLWIARKNGKSTLCTPLGPFFLMADGENAPQVYCCASNEGQARIVFNEAKTMVENSRLLDFLSVQRSAIVCKSNNGVLRVLTGKGGGQHGLNTSAAIFDELHEWKTPSNEELHAAIKTSTGARIKPQIWRISTAGFDKTSLAYGEYVRGKELASQGIDAMREAGHLVVIFEAPEDADIEDPNVWRLANPSSFAPIERYMKELRTGELPESKARRLHLNQWVATEEIWLPLGTWGACAQPGVEIPLDAPIHLGVDFGYKKDSAAIVRRWERPDGRVVFEKAAHFEPKPDNPVQFVTVENAIRKECRERDVRAVGFDPWNFERSAQELNREGIRMVEQSMRDGNVAPGTKVFRDRIINKQVVHNNDPALTRHVMNSRLKDTNYGQRLTKSKTGDDANDLCMASLVADMCAAGDVDTLIPYIAFT